MVYSSTLSAIYASSTTPHAVTPGCAAGPEEATQRREPLEGPVIDFFRPILGFLFRTLVCIGAHHSSLSSFLGCLWCASTRITMMAQCICKCVQVQTDTACHSWPLAMLNYTWGILPIAHGENTLLQCRGCIRSSTPTAAPSTTWWSSSSHRHCAAP